jgi:hypothetical protein
MKWSLFKWRSSATAQEELPPILFKFVSAAKCHHWLSGRTIGFPSLRRLNDPYESLILRNNYSGAGALNLNKDVPFRRIRIGKMVMEDAINPDYDPEARSERIEKEEELNLLLAAQHARQCAGLDQLGILSLTRSSKSMTMWAHYAQNSTGLCLGIVWKEVCESGDAGGEGTVLSLNYEGAPGAAGAVSDAEFIALALGRKQSDWAYEREVRLVRPLRFFPKRIEGGDIGILPLNPAWIREIVVGVMPAPAVLTLLKDNWDAFSHAQLSQLRLHARGYEPEIVRLKDPGEVVTPKLFPLARADSG